MKRRTWDYDEDSINRAKRHIQEAKELSSLLAGADKDVKSYFFSLPEYKLDEVFSEYGKHYNRGRGTPDKPNAEQYARQTFHKWASGKVRMSGMVAERLFNLLPPLMSLDDKYSLIDKMWKNYSPRSSIYLRVGIKVSEEELIEKIRSHLENKVVSYKIPLELRQRFEWLSQNDAEASQQLLNHYLQQERELVDGYLQNTLPVIKKHFEKFSESNFHGKITEKITVGKHEVHLFFDDKVSGIQETSKPVSKSAHSTGVKTSKDQNSSTTGNLLGSIISAIIAIIILVIISKLLFGS